MGPLANSLSFLIYEILIIVPIPLVLFLDEKFRDGNMGGMLENNRQKKWESRKAYRIIGERLNHLI